MGVTKTELKPGQAKKTLRMKTNGAAVVEDEPASEVSVTINKIDELLEKAIGIRDNELSTTLYHICKDVKAVCITKQVQLTLELINAARPVRNSAGPAAGGLRVPRRVCAGCI
jgi:hypothetical protein